MDGWMEDFGARKLRISTDHLGNTMSFVVNTEYYAAADVKSLSSALASFV